MKLKEAEAMIKSLEMEKLNHAVEPSDYYDALNQQIRRIKQDVYSNPSPWDRVHLARHSDRPKAHDYIDALTDGFMELHGDRLFHDDHALIGGIGWFDDFPITVLAQSKGQTLDENLMKNFGMLHPEGYRKAMRLAKQAQKFNRPILNIIDTSGAYPGKGAEERGQAEAIAQCLKLFSGLSVPVISVVIGEGGSGGALAMGVADRVVMLENAIYSILSPEGFASILWKDGTRAEEASALMGLTAQDLFEGGIIDQIINEPLGGAQVSLDAVTTPLKSYLREEYRKLRKLKKSELLDRRYKKYREIGVIA